MRRFLILAVAGGALAGGTASAQTPGPDVMLNYRPAQKDVEYDSPAVADVPKCRVELVRGKVSGYEVFDPSGQLLRRFVDASGDRTIDQWRYYKDGVEVYRDIDSNGNNKIDQSRWLNTAGARWGLDPNEDTRIDEWKQLSAQEASRVAITAMAAGDMALLKTVLLTAEDCDQLGLTDEIRKLLLAQVAQPEEAVGKVMSASAAFNKTSRWIGFDAKAPGAVPADDGKARDDLQVYSGAMAIIDTAGKTSFVTVGELLRVGEVWKLTGIPQASEGEQVIVQAGVLMRPMGGTAPVSRELSPEMLKLIQQLQDLDKLAPAPGTPDATVIGFLKKRNELLTRIVLTGRTPDEFNTWMKQLVNGLAAAAQSGDAEARAVLVQRIGEVRKQQPMSDLIPYAEYRLGMADSMSAMRGARNQTEQQAAQTRLQTSLTAFIKAWPAAEDTPDAMYQLATNSEFSGQLPAAEKWYGELQKNFPDSPYGRRAAGALRRIGLKGQPLTLAGMDLAGKPVNVSSLKGNVVLVVFWASWAQQFAQDLPVLQALQTQYGGRGFATLGVNLDSDAKAASDFTTQNKVAWPLIHDAGGLEGALAEQFGLITVPTMMLVDRNGNVLASGLTLNELKDSLPQVMK